MLIGTTGSGKTTELRSLVSQVRASEDTAVIFDLTGAYVEARTAEVFTGGCIMNSEAETVGKQAVLAWKVDRGSFNGIAIDGLSVVAAVSGDRNLGMQEMGGEKPAVHSAMYVDERANSAQQLALVAIAISPVLAYSAYRYSRRSQPVVKDVQQKIADVTTIAEENIVGVRVVKAFAQEPEQQGHFSVATERVFSRSMDAAKLAAPYIPFMSALPSLGIAAVVLLRRRFGRSASR